MRRTWTIALLAVGTVAGFGAGFARLHQHHRGDTCQLRSGALERRAADACTRAALELLREQKSATADR